MSSNTEPGKNAGAASAASAKEVEVAGDGSGVLVAVGVRQGVDLGDLKGTGTEASKEEPAATEEEGEEQDEESTVFTYGGDNQEWEHFCDGNYVPRSEPGGLEMMQLEAEARARKLRHERGHLYTLGEDGDVVATMHTPTEEK
jgi:hypothetical protein